MASGKLSIKISLKFKFSSFSNLPIDSGMLFKGLPYSESYLRFFKLPIESGRLLIEFKFKCRYSRFSKSPIDSGRLPK